MKAARRPDRSAKVGADFEELDEAAVGEGLVGLDMDSPDCETQYIMKVSSIMHSLSIARIIRFR